ncbi:RDD family protein [Endozoicomonas sp.]|nr:RDD family protein [Endozoicomonas sp.]
MNSVQHKQLLPTAPLWRRLVAMIYDSFLVLALLILVGFLNLGIQITVYGESQLRAMTDQGYTLDGPLLYTSQVLTIFCFFTFFWRKKGQTLGMQAWRIRIVNDDLQTLTYRQIVVRCLIAIPSTLLCLTGILWMKVDPEQKSWPDRLSKTRTVLLEAIDV